MKYIAPKILKPNAKFAVVAPASSFDSCEVYRGLQILQEQGFSPILGENIFFLRTNGLYSAPLEKRIEEFTWAIEDNTIDAIICATGGFGSAQILPYLPYEKIAKTRKPIIGFSDISAINNAILAKSNLITFNGPMVSVRTDTYDHEEKDKKSLEFALELLQTNESWGSKPFIDNKFLPRCVSMGTASGPSIGGNLSTIETLIGTPYMPDSTGAILFIEDTHESGYEISKLLSHLKLAEILDKLSGIVVGRFTAQKDASSADVPSIEQVIVEHLQDGPPCIFGLNFSHITSSATIPIGAETTVDANKLQVTFGNPFA
ncbi:MAG TPA: LD-carboxypeptidase [Candidatus Glassbacteria bacterium]|nr:LD-carboxypeptidase [Candidatus Glassbacteria bacterium]